VSLRKKKTSELINAKRRRLLGAADTNSSPSDDAGNRSKSNLGGENNIYNGSWGVDKEVYEATLKEVCAQFVFDRSLSLVSEAPRPLFLLLIISLR
jgi:hypothetical protein